MTGTLGYLSTVIETKRRGRPEVRRRSANAVKRGTLSLHGVLS